MILTETKAPITLKIPDFSVVVLMGVSGSGKSTFAASHFLRSEILSSDQFRAMVSDDENDQTATKDAFDALHALADIRLRRRKLVVIDATNTQPEARKPYLELAARHDIQAVAIVLDVPERVCQARNRERADRQFGPHVVANQSRQLRQSLRSLKREGFRHIFTLKESEIAAAQIVRVPLWTDRRNETGPFDILGDIHGCYEELTELLAKLGYAPDAEIAPPYPPSLGESDEDAPLPPNLGEIPRFRPDSSRGIGGGEGAKEGGTEGAWRHPAGRRVIFVGDLVDRGPKIVETIRLAMAMVKAGTALCVPGNHDIKLMRALKGHAVTVSHGLADSLEQIEALPEAERETFKQEYIPFADTLVSHFWLAGGKLCAAHAGMKEAYIGRASGRVRDFALYGETTGETDEFGLPIRYPWAQDYRGSTTVVYGHTPVPEAEWLNNTLNIDTGCVFGGKLTALRWPEREMVQVAAHQTYSDPIRSLHTAPPSKTQSVPDAVPSAEEAAVRETLAELVRKMTAGHVENRRKVATALTHRNNLQAEMEKQERIVRELERQAETAAKSGNAALAAAFQREQALHEQTLESIRALNRDAHAAMEKAKKALWDEEQALQERAQEAGIEISDDDLELASAPEEPIYSPDDFEAEQVVMNAAQAMQKNQIRNRALAVEAITQKNNLHAEVARQERLLAELERKATKATKGEDHEAAQHALDEKARVFHLLEEMRPHLAAAIEAAEKVKESIRQEEENFRRRVAEALATKMRLRQQQIESRMDESLHSFYAANHDMEAEWAKALSQLQAVKPAASAYQEIQQRESSPLPRDAQHPTASLQWQHDDLLRAEDVLGKRIVTTRLKNSIPIPAENAAAALEVMSRFAVEPRWLIYLPPTMSPCETAPSGETLERPAEAFAYYRTQGVEQVVCQRKHMGSRAIVVICRDEEAAHRRFGVSLPTEENIQASGRSGVEGEAASSPIENRKSKIENSPVLGQCYTRTGRQFFDDPALHSGLLREVADTLTRAGFWETFQTDWACLDCELMPWNAKAQGLLRDQYAPVGAAAKIALDQAIAVTEAAIGRGLDLGAQLAGLRQRQEDIGRYTDAYARYCWEVRGLEDIRLAPFHLLATEGHTYFDRDHDWHIATLARFAEHSPLFLATESRTVQVQDEVSQAEGEAWWQEMTETGGEGMVVKPQTFIAQGLRGLIQPAVKVRGREYLRIIYGPEYTEPENLERLRQRGLGAKRSLALREFALGLEGLERFVRREPLRRVHECVFGVLALESEPVDPRL